MFDTDAISKYLNFSGKIFIWTLPFLVIFFCIMSYRDRHICEPERIKFEQNMEYLRQNEYAIKEIKLIKYAPEYSINLINKDTVIYNSEVNANIRSMIINNKSQENINRATLAWEVLMILYLSNNEQIQILVRGLKNPVYQDKTNIIFIPDKCSEDYTLYALNLGEYLEKITNYKGERYK